MNLQPRLLAVRGSSTKTHRYYSSLSLPVCLSSPLLRGKKTDDNNINIYPINIKMKRPCLKEQLSRLPQTFQRPVEESLQ